MCRCCVVSSSVLSRGLTCYASRGVSSGVVLNKPILCAMFHGVVPCVTVLRVRDMCHAMSKYRVVFVISSMLCCVKW